MARRQTTADRSAVPRKKKSRPRRVPADAEILNAQAAAEVLGISERQTIQYAREGKLPATKLGREWRFLRSALRNHIAGKTGGDELLKALQKSGVKFTVRK
jgi:excisionase family DNA binding protein